jgi:hypothetical protein
MAVVVVVVPHRTSQRVRKISQYLLDLASMEVEMVRPLDHVVESSFVQGRGMLTYMVHRQVNPELVVRVEAVVAVFLTETRARETLTLSTMESEPQVVPEGPEQ